MVLAQPACLAQHFELNWKLLILLLSVTAKEKKKKEKKIYYTKLPSFTYPPPVHDYFCLSV